MRRLAKADQVHALAGLGKNGCKRIEHGHGFHTIINYAGCFGELGSGIIAANFKLDGSRNRPLTDQDQVAAPARARQFPSQSFSSVLFDGGPDVGVHHPGKNADLRLE